MVARNRLLLIRGAFWVGLGLLTIQDLVLLCDVTGSAKALTVAGAILDAALFSAVFVLFRAELREQLRTEQVLQRANDAAARANRELAAANALKFRFLHIAAHDLRNPLNALGYVTRLIREDLYDPAALLESADRIDDSTREMLVLIDDLLHLAESEHGAHPMRFAPTNLRTLAERVIAVNVSLAARKNILLELAGDDEDCLVHADDRAMTRVVDNLVSNAIKFSPPGKTVRVVVAPLNGMIQLSVQDEGPGLNDDDLEKLFQPFERLSARPTAGEKSTGLGLSIVKDLVDAQHGRVWAERRSQGSGSGFFVELPAAHPPGAGVAESIDSPEKPLLYQGKHEATV